jgi:DNA-directed RNA polymerase subunit RPC12/RpoP
MVAKPFACSTCPKRYATQRGLATHQKYECGKTAQAQCPYCEYRCKQPWDLKKHCKNAHGVMLDKPRSLWSP